MAFMIKAYVCGFLGRDNIFFASSPGKARRKSWDRARSLRDDLTFSDFLKRSSFRSASKDELPRDFGRDIMINGSPAFMIRHEGGNSVLMAFPDSEHVSSCHELEIRNLPLEGEDRYVICDPDRGGFGRCGGGAFRFVYDRELDEFHDVTVNGEDAGIDDLRRARVIFHYSCQFPDASRTAPEPPEWSCLASLPSPGC